MESVNLLTTLFLTPAELKAPDKDLPSEGGFEEILSGSYSSVERKDIQQKESEDKSFPSLMMIFSTLLGQNNSFPNTSFQDIHADEIQNIQPPQLPLSLREGAVTQWQGEESSPIAPTLDRGFFQVDPSKGISTSPSILGQPVLTLNDIGTPPPVQLPMSPSILGQPVLTLNDIGTPPPVQLPMSPSILGQPVLTLNDIGTPPPVQLPTSSPIPEDIPFQVMDPVFQKGTTGVSSGDAELDITRLNFFNPKDHVSLTENSLNRSEEGRSPLPSMGKMLEQQGGEFSPIAPTLDRGFFQVDPSKGISTSPSILGQPVLTLNDIGTPPPVQLPTSPSILGQPVLTLNDIGTPPLVQLPTSPSILGQPVLTLNDTGTPPLVQLPTSSPIPEDIPFQVGSPASPGFSSLKQVTSSLSSSEDNISPGSGPIRHIEMPVVDSKGTHSNAMDMESNNGLLNRDPKGLERILFDLQDLVSKSEGQGGHPSEVTNILNDPKGGFDVTPVVSEELPKAVEPTHSRAEHPQIYEQIGKKIIWTLKNNEERIRLTLEPPQLGNIYMEINRGGGNIRATLWTDNPVTKEILEMNQSQLHRILKEDGFKLEKFEVFTQQDMESFRERGESLYDHSPWAKNGFRGLKASPFIEPVEITPTEMNLSHRGNNSIDVFV